MSSNYIIFDYDDTLLASHFISLNNISFDKLIPKETLDLFNELSIQVLKLLNKAILCGEVVIITNAQAGWIEESSKKLMPTVYEFIINKKIKLISARNEMEKTIPDPTRWKAIIFQKYFELSYEKKTNINVISFGDNYYDRYALFNLTSNSINLKKNVKLLDKPTINQLINQLILINKLFDKIITFNKELDVRIEFNTILDDNLENINNIELDRIILDSLFELPDLYDFESIFIDELYMNS
jgi:hypothetical protein